MPPVGAAIAGLFGAGGIFGAGTLGGILVKIGAGFGLNYVANALRAKSSADQLVDAERPVGTKFKLAGGGKVPRSFILGRWATAGSLVYHGSHGDAGKIPNSKYVQVHALSDLPVTDLVAILVNGRDVTYDPDGGQSAPGQAIPQYTKGGKDNFWVRFHDGTQGSADSHLVAKFEDDDDYPWNANFVGTGIAYAMFTARYNEKLWAGGGDINVTWVVQGLKLYDIRKDTTAGGSGSHRWNNPSTWEFTRNPVVMIYNIIRGISYDGEWVYGGQSFGAAQLPFASWAAAMNECDAPIDLKGGGTQPQFRAGGEIELSSEPLDTIERLLMACNGRLADCGGVYKIHVGAAGSPVYSFTDGDIIIDEEQTFDPFPGHDATVNGIVASYVSPDSGWTEKNARPRINAGYVAADGGRQLLANVSYDFVSTKQQVQRLSKAALEEARRFRRHVVVLPPVAAVLEPLDFVAWTSPRNGYSSKLFRVDEVDIRPNLDVAVYLTEVDPSDYDWNESTDELDENDEGTFFAPPTVPALADWTAMGVVIAGDGGVALPGIRLMWDPDPDIDEDGAQSISRIDFEVRLASTLELVYASNTPFVSAGAIDISQNIVSNTQYEVRGRYFSPVLDTTWTGWIPVTTPDVKIKFEQLEAQFKYLVDTVLKQENSFLHQSLDLIRQRLDETALAAAVDINETHHQRKIIAKLIAKETADRFAAVLLEATARVDGDTALAELVALLQAQFDTSLAQAILQIQANATAISAQAALLTAVSAVANGVSANGFMRLSAVSAPSGVTARFAVLLNVGTAGSPNFKQTGFFLDITGSGASAVSRAVFDVNQFYIGSTAQPSVPHALAFAVIGGQVYIRNALIQNLTAANIAANSITAALIQANAITADKIQVNAITVGKIVDGAVSQVYTDSGGSIVLGAGLGQSPVDITVPHTRGSIVVFVTGNITTQSAIVIELYRTRNNSDTVIGSFVWAHSGGMKMSLVVTDYPGQGDSPVNCRYRIKAVPGSNGSLQNTAMTVVWFRK